MSQLNRDVKAFICWAQKHTCLLCQYPLALHKHFHHVIARDDGGPEHYLNLVALCPNHHWLVERIKRHIIPNRPISSHPLKTSSAALQLYNELDVQMRNTLDILSKPHEMSGVVKKGVSQDLLVKATNDLMIEDARLLDEINMKRPRIFLSPDSIPLSEDIIDVQASKMTGQVGFEFYSGVITAHMVNLHLPYKVLTINTEPIT